MFVTISIEYVKAWSLIWTIYYSLFFLFVLFESERLMRLSFLQNKVVLYHEANRNELVATARLHARAMRKARYELQIVSIQAEKDKYEIERERARLRSLIGNVAHDLKTPLQSIGEYVHTYRLGWCGV
jgi:signal transduction histidine kinase